MDVTVTNFRAELKHWLALAQDGEEIVVTDRGTPVAKLMGIEAQPMIDRLTAEGVIGRPKRSSRPQVAIEQLPHTARPLSDRVVEQRR